MIIEAVIGWFFSVVSNAISLLPTVGTQLTNIPKIALTFLKYAGVMNGYAPVAETGVAFLVMLGVWLSLIAVRVIISAFNLVTKIIP